MRKNNKEKNDNNSRLINMNFVLLVIVIIYGFLANFCVIPILNGFVDRNCSYEISVFSDPDESDNDSSTLDENSSTMNDSNDSFKLEESSFNNMVIIIGIGFLALCILYLIVSKKVLIFVICILFFVPLFYYWYSVPKMLVNHKPVLYLYPEKDTNVTINFEKENLLLTTYPKYNKGWNIKAMRDGSLYDSDNKYYYALYWEEKSINPCIFEDGFYVEGKDAIKFLEEKLTYVGLSDKERNEFIMYWLPVLEKNKKSIVQFDFTKEIESFNRIIIDPKPDSLLRLHINIKKVNKYTNIKEQKLERFDRKGFTAVEWGGSIIDN